MQGVHSAAFCQRVTDTFYVSFCFFIYRYNSPQHIMEEFFTLRMDYYHRRKAALLNKMQNEWRKLDNKVCVPKSVKFPFRRLVSR